MMQPVLKPKALRVGDTIGVFTPSSPAYKWNEGLFVNGLKNLERLGFKIKLGHLTRQRASQGYRSGAAEERANEFMSLVRDPDVHGLMSTIGGMNSSSLIPHLDFDEIRKQRKLFCGFSDVTSLHASILAYAGLRTLYGPSVMCWFGDWPNGIPESSQWFMDAAVNHRSGTRRIEPPSQWSNHKRRWDNDDWKTIPREWQANDGWHVLNPGSAEAQILAFNLNTMMSSAGTSYWPDFKNKILLVEDMEAPLARTERSLQQLKLTGALNQIAGLIVGKPEFYSQDGAPFGYDDLIREIVGPRDYPIISNFDCSHTVPMISVPQLSPVRLRASGDRLVEFEFLDGAID